MGKTLKHILAESLFFRLYIVFFVAWTYLIISTNKPDLLLQLNNTTSSFADAIMPWITRLGEEWIVAPIILFLFLYKVRYGVMIMASGFAAAGTTQVLKRHIFDWPRPSAHPLIEKGQLHLIDGIELHSSFSFPSGHTTSAFAVFTFLALITLKQKYLGFLFCFLAILVGYSRCYLGQHFPEDILAGSFIGVFFSVLSYLFFSTKKFGEKGLLFNR